MSRASAIASTGLDDFGDDHHEEALAVLCRALTDDVERRIEQALISGTSGDAQLVLLALHAKIVQASVVDAFDLQAG